MLAVIDRRRMENGPSGAKPLFPKFTFYWHFHTAETYFSSQRKPEKEALSIDHAQLR